MKHDAGQPPSMHGVKFCSGLYYKRRKENAACYWDGDEWRVSNKSWSDVTARATITPHKGKRKDAKTKY